MLKAAGVTTPLEIDLWYHAGDRVPTTRTASASPR